MSFLTDDEVLTPHTGFQMHDHYTQNKPKTQIQKFIFTTADFFRFVIPQLVWPPGPRFVFLLLSSRCLTPGTRLLFLIFYKNNTTNSHAFHAHYLGSGNITLLGFNQVPTFFIPCNQDIFSNFYTFCMNAISIKADLLSITFIAITYPFIY